MTQPEALGYAVSLEARGFVAEASELRRLHEENEALRQALAQPEQEPVTGMFEEKLPDQNPPPWVRDYNACLPTSVKCNAIKYTAPQKRGWVMLTKEEKFKVLKEFFGNSQQMIDAVEAKSKEKNT